MVSTSAKPRVDLPHKLHDNMGGYIEPLGKHLLAYLGFEEHLPDAALTRIGAAIDALRLERGMAKEYNVFTLRVAHRWSYRRLAEHYATGSASIHRWVAAARAWILAYLRQDEASAA